MAIKEQKIITIKEEEKVHLFKNDASSIRIVDFIRIYSIKIS